MSGSTSKWWLLVKLYRVANKVPGTYIIPIAGVSTEDINTKLLDLSINRYQDGNHQMWLSLLFLLVLLVCATPEDTWPRNNNRYGNSTQQYNPTKNWKYAMKYVAQSNSFFFKGRITKHLSNITGLRSHHRRLSIWKAYISFMNVLRKISAHRTKTTIRMQHHHNYMQTDAWLASSHNW